MRAAGPVLVLLAAVACDGPRKPALPPIPDALAVPAGHIVAQILKAKGKQVYTCKAPPGDEQPGALAWVFEEPIADLIDRRGASVGRHFKGPSWQSIDGSKIVGVQQASAPSPDGDTAIPWLLIEVTAHERPGVFADLTYVQRISTVGGRAPVGGCDAAHAGEHNAVDYEATYVFYFAKP